MALKFLGLLLIALNFVPLEIIFGEIKGFKWAITPYIWLLSCLIVLLISWLTNSLFPNQSKKLVLKLTSLTNQFSNNMPIIGIPIILILTLLISTYAFSNRPLLIDSIVQLFQAEIFASGNLKATLPPYIEFFVTQHMIFDEGGWYGQYPPGHSLLLSIGVLLKAPWLISPILSACSAILIYKFIENVFSKPIANYSLALLMLSPFYMFMGASYMNHVTSLFCISAVYYSFSKYEKTNKKSYLLASSFMAGFGLLVRPLDMIASLIPLIPGYLKTITKAPKNLILLLGGGTPPVLLGLWYNLQTTGKAFLPGYIKLWGAAHGLGFHTSPWGAEHSPLTGLRNELTDIQLLNEMLFEWPIPSLAFVSLYLIFCPVAHVWAKRLIIMALSFPCLYFFYWHRDAFLGPRFMYPTVLAWVPLSAFALSEIMRNYGDKNIQIFNLFSPIKIKVFIVSILFFSLLFSVAINIPLRYHAYESSLASMKEDLIEKAKSAGITKGLLFVKNSWGVRIISNLRGLGVSASLTQIAYSNLDHCDLSTLVKRATKLSWTRAKIVEEIESMLSKGREVYTVKINFDPSLKLSPVKPLSSVCKDELIYDLKDGQQDYTIYEPHMRANSPTLNRNFIIAKDLRGKNHLLINEFPNLPAYLYNGTYFQKLPLN